MTTYYAETSTRITSVGGCHTIDARGRDVCDAISSVGLLVLNSDEPTFIRLSAASTAIDLALVSERWWKHHADTTGSDHCSITLLPSHVALRECRVVQWPHFRELCANIQSSDDFFLCIIDCGERATTRCVVPAGTPHPDIKLLNLHAVLQPAQRRMLRSSFGA
ncbi:hypothetical protein MRX96_034957 [Rhipicephalus microplus]